MLSGWGDHPAVRAVLAEGSDALGEDMARLIAEGPKEKLDQTINTQPAMLLAGVACFRAWIAEGAAQPRALAGHSLGEFTALTAAGSLQLADAVRLVRFRAEVMQQAVPQGAGGMAAILGLEDEVVIRVCAQASAESDETVEAVNFNGGGQIVIAGTARGVELACQYLKQAGAKRALPLAVSAPFHSSLMRAAAERLKEKLATIAIAPPCWPLINNIDVQSPSDAAAIRDALFRQAFGPVRWSQSIRALAAMGIVDFVECGPGKVLAGLVRRIDPALSGHAVFDPASLAATRTVLVP